MISAVNIHINADSDVIFASAGVTDNPDTTFVETIAASGVFTGLTGTQGLTDATLGGTNSIRGRFVGQDVEGPLGVMGTYVIDAAGIAGTARMMGSFGADRP